MDFKEHLKALETTAFDTNKTAKGTITIKQTQRNAVRNALVPELAQFLVDNDINAWMTRDGVVINIDNDSVGEVNIELKLSIKGLDYNLDEEIDKFKELEDVKAKRASKKK